MSFLAAIIDPEAGATLAADTIVTDPATRNVMGFDWKLDEGPAPRCVLGFTGAGALMGNLLLEMPEHVDDLDALLNILPAAFQRAHAGTTAGFTEADARCNVVVAGWSLQAGRYRGFSITSYRKKTIRPGEFREPWSLNEIEPGTIYLNTEIDAADIEQCGYPPAEDEIDEHTLTRLVCAARQFSPKSGTNIGGNITLARVGAEGVDLRIMHEWPEDVIGHPVDPSRGAVLPDYLTDAT